MEHILDDFSNAINKYFTRVSKACINFWTKLCTTHSSHFDIDPCNRNSVFNFQVVSILFKMYFWCSLSHLAHRTIGMLLAIGKQYHNNQFAQSKPNVEQNYSEQAQSGTYSCRAYSERNQSLWHRSVNMKNVETVFKYNFYTDCIQWKAIFKALHRVSEYFLCFSGSLSGDIDFNSHIKSWGSCWTCFFCYWIEQV